MAHEEILHANDTAVCICCHDDHWFLEKTIRSFAPLPITVFVSTKSWGDSDGDPQKCVDAANKAGAEVVLGEWSSESDHRKAALAEMKRRGIRWLFIPDGDEPIERKLLNNLLALSKAGVYDHYRVRMFTYWKSPRYRIFPPENIAPVILIDAQKCEHLEIREYSFTSSTTLGFEQGAIHHLSYAGPDERILRKISTWSHKNQLVPEWWTNVWLTWDHDRTLRMLHPTDPVCYGYAERIPVPEFLKDVPDERPELMDPEFPKNWDTISVVIALHGGEEYIYNTLKSIERCGVGKWPQGELVTVVGKGKRARAKIRFVGGPPIRADRPPLFHEVIVVDDCSPDRAAEVAASFPFVKLIRNKTNEGFAATNNTGIEASTGNYIYLLNSDVQVTRASTIELGKVIMSEGTIGAVGPMSNAVGYQQLFPPTMSNLANLELFCRDFAHREVEPFENSMVVGFAVMIPRRLFSEVGMLDTVFGKCLYEDTDYMHRLWRSHYRCMVVPTSFVFHEGSKSLGRTGEHIHTMMSRNRVIYENKHRLDKESGFTRYLAGDRPGPMVFDESKRPETLIKQMKQLARKHQVCVAMIGRDEERCVGEAIDSLLGIFFQVVFVDTGSTDRTVEIVKEKGCEVFLTKWQDSFSIARNFSLSKVKGKWVFWIDCDDFVPFQTLLALLQAIDSALPHIVGFVIPVQFVEGIPGLGTRVDHVKAFRMDKERHFFEGRLHEQILPSLRATGGEVGRIDSPVLHKNYDTSPEGQRKKRIRDRRLLRLDLQDRPGHPFVLFNLGMTAYFNGKFRVAIGWLRRTIAVSGMQDSHIRKAYALYAEALHKLGRTNEAILTAQTGLAQIGEDPELRFNLARYLTDEGQLVDAKANYEAINPDISGFFSSVDIGILTFKRFIGLGAVCFGLGLEGQAKNYLREAVRTNPLHPGCAIALLEGAMRTGDIVCAREAADALAGCQGFSEQWAMAMASIADLAGIGAEAELVRLVNWIPNEVGPGIVLARRLLGAGRLQEAAPLLRNLEFHGSAEGAQYLAEICARAGQLDEALAHARIAVQLEPGREGARHLHDSIVLAQEDLKPLPAFTGGIGSAVLTGPHAGRLGEASLDNSVVVVAYNSQATIRECADRVLRTIGE